MPFLRAVIDKEQSSRFMGALPIQNLRPLLREYAAGFQSDGRTMGHVAAISSLFHSTMDSAQGGDHNDLFKSMFASYYYRHCYVLAHFCRFGGDVMNRTVPSPEVQQELRSETSAAYALNDLIVVMRTYLRTPHELRARVEGALAPARADPYDSTPTTYDTTAAASGSSAFGD